MCDRGSWTLGLGSGVVLAGIVALEGISLEG